MSQYTIPNLKNACRVLKYLAGRRIARRPADVAKTLSIPRTSVIRILNTLEGEGFVRKDADGFWLGPALIGLGTASQASIHVREVARRYLSDVVARTGETCHLAVPFEAHSLIIEVERSQHPLTATSQPGTPVDLHCSATGKVFLAFHFRKRRRQILDESQLTRHTANTLTTPEDLEAEMTRIEAQGFAIDEQEYFLGVRCIAAPIFDHENKVIAAIGITSSVHRFRPENTDEMAAIIREAALGISRQLGMA